MTDQALYRRKGATTFVPLQPAAGPWDPNTVHGAAVSALFAGQLAPTDRTLARLTIEFLGPVPHTPLTLECSTPSGGRRVQRQDAVLSAAGRPVATATAVLVLRSQLDLPDKARDHPSPFDPAAAPPLEEPNRAAAATVGHDSFDSSSLIIEFMKVPGDPRTHQWIGLAVPVVEGTELTGVELAAVAADYAQAAVNRQLPFTEWAFRNTEMTLHLAREPVGRWIGVRCEAVVSAVGAGFNAAELFDAEGRVARSASALVVERRPDPAG